jgi:pyruvate dehydrogenase E1 component alpha subunit
VITPPTDAATLDPLSADTAAAIHRTMVRIRVFESRVEELFKEGKLPGFVHTYLGQEAVAASVCALLESTDYITSTHRGHGHGIAKGMTTDVLMAELFGKATGANKGRGGSMHVADFSRGMLGANAIVGGGISLAVGGGLAAQTLADGRVAVTFFGDGASNEGIFHESLNLAAIWKLPVVFVCENNRYAMGTAIQRALAQTDISKYAASYGMPGEACDGMDVFAVRDCVGRAVARAREKRVPSLVEARTYRFRGHSMRDPAAAVYRTKDEVEEEKQRDPIVSLRDRLRAAGALDEAAWDALADRVEARVNDAVAFADASPEPPAEWLTADVYA